MTGAPPQPGTPRAPGRQRSCRAARLLLVVGLVLPLGGCLIPLASDLGMAHSYLHHHHLLKPVLPELSADEQPPCSADIEMLGATKTDG